MSWKTFIVIIVTMFITPILITGTTALLGAKAKDNLISIWGTRGQLYAGGLGTALHEVGHLLMALAFHHHITGFKLCQFRHLDTSPTLGYVNHTWQTTSFYQSLGNFFIGIAPFFSCTGFLLLIHWLLMRTQYRFNVGINQQSMSITIKNVFLNCIMNIKDSLFDDLHNPLETFIFILLIFAVSVTGYAISIDDWHGTLYGFAQYIVLILIISAITFLAMLIDSQSQFFIWKFVALLLFLTVTSWLYVIFSILLIIGVKYAFYHGQSRYHVIHHYPHFIYDLKHEIHRYL